MPKRKTVGNKNTVGCRIVELRKQHHMKQIDLMAQLQTKGVDLIQSSLSDLEGQKRTVTDKELRALAEIFGVTIEELYNQN